MNEEIIPLNENDLSLNDKKVYIVSIQNKNKDIINIEIFSNWDLANKFYKEVKEEGLLMNLISVFINERSNND